MAGGVDGGSRKWIANVKAARTGQKRCTKHTIGIFAQTKKLLRGTTKRREPKIGYHPAYTQGHIIAIRRWEND
jgi:hypothetical protein